MKPKKREATYTMKEIAEAWEYTMEEWYPWKTSPLTETFKRALRAGKRKKRGGK